MCGVAGIISKDSSTLGNDLINMLKELIHRGKDATGVAIYENRDTIDVRVSMTEPSHRQELEEIIQKFGSLSNSRIYQGEGIFIFYESSIEMDPESVTDLNWAIDTHPDLCVHSIGRRIKIYKDEGSAEELRQRHKIPDVRGSHGIGHVRLATESVENINFAHPFVSYIYPELALVHNGQFTNYFNMRRKMENWGIRFKTNNDSEMAAHFIAHHIKEKGMALEEGATLIRVRGIREGKSVCLDNYINAPGLTESFEKYGITHESFLTGQSAFLFTKLFVNDMIAAKGVYPPEVLEAEPRRYYLAEAAKLGITVDEIVETRLF